MATNLVSLAAVDAELAALFEANAQDAQEIERLHAEIRRREARIRDLRNRRHALRPSGRLAALYGNDQGGYYRAARALLAAFPHATDRIEAEVQKFTGCSVSDWIYGLLDVVAGEPRTDAGDAAIASVRADLRG